MCASKRCSFSTAGEVSKKARVVQSSVTILSSVPATVTQHHRFFAQTQLEDFLTGVEEGVECSDE
jgi:hypothetical protein